MKNPARYISAAVIFLAVLSCKAQNSVSLTAAEFEKGINSTDTIQVLDLRTSNEYNSGHIKNALLADWKEEQEFNRRLSFIDKNKPVYVYCLAGGRSAAAAERMRKLGYEKVYELNGGINAWKAAGKQVEGTADEKQMTPEELNTAINGSRMVLVDFGAEWCPPCKKMSPVLKSLQANNPGVFTLIKIDGGRDLDLLKKYQVTMLPVFILYKDGRQVWRKDGIAEEKEIADQFQ